MRTNTAFGLPYASLNLISGGLFWLMICLGIRIVKGSDLALKVANTQVVIANSADNLSSLATELDNQAEVLKQKDQAYEELSKVYEQSLKDDQGYERLKAKIETIDQLPEVENLEDIKAKIEITESDLEEVPYQ